MEKLDQPTLILFNAIINTVVGFIMFALKIYANKIKGPGSWAIGSFLQAIGIILFRFGPYSDYLTFVISGTVIALGWSFYLLGLWRFKNKKPNWFLFLICPLLQLLQGTIFVYIVEIPQIRMINFSFIIFLVSLFTAIEFIKPYKSYLRSIFLIAGIVYFIRALAVLSRSIQIILNLEMYQNEEYSIRLIVLIITSVAMLILLTIFILIVMSYLVEKAKSESVIKNKLFNIIAHDLKSSVGNIKEFLSFINTYDNISESERKKYLQRIEKQSGSTYELLINLLHWSRNQTDRLKPYPIAINISESVMESLTLFDQPAKSKSITINNLVNEDTACLFDQTMFNSCIRNLISNAIKFTNFGGLIELKSIPKEDCVELSISDNGVGMDEGDILDFNNNKQLNSNLGTNYEKGTGIGLSLCRDFVELNKANIEIHSIKNKGTTVILKIKEA